MKSPFVPVALGVVASLSIPLQVSANDSMPLESGPSTASAQSTQIDTPSADDASNGVSESYQPTSSAEMPVSQEIDASYTEASGALNFEPPQLRSAASTVSEPQTKSVAVASPEDSQRDSAIAARPNQPSQEKSPVPEAPVKRDFGGATLSKSNPNDLFDGGSASLVARTVGAAEGTRTADGGKTQNYHGHVDPGNGVWNRGTFSYQFGNSENLSPDEADRRQLAKIKRIYESVMLPKAQKHGVAPLTLEEEINGIDLINQAPLTVTEDGGYIERLAEAKQKGLTGSEAILNARIWSFWDGGKGGWDAPGLRAYDDIGKEESIRRDQDRRMGMISKALKSYEKENGDIASHPKSEQKSESKSATAFSKDNSQTRDSIADAIIFGEKPTTRG